MIKNLFVIFTRHKYKIAFTYMLMLVEFILDSLMPLFLGRAVDALLSNTIVDFYVFIAVMVFSLFIGTARRRIDTRTFMCVYKDNMLSTIKKMLASYNDRAKIVSRTHLVRTYGDFMEYTLPTIISAIIEIIVSLLMLWWVIPMVSYWVAALVVMAIVVQKVVSDRMMIYERAWQEACENIDKSILENNYDAVTDYIGQALPNHVKRSDVEAFCWNIIDLMSIVTQIFVIYSLTANNHSTGAILSTVSYCRSVFAKTNFINFLFTHLRQFKLSEQLINSHS